MKILLIASKNPGKIKEIKDILAGIPYEIKSLIDIDYKEEVEETGKSFEENAILKAKKIGKETNFVTLADDSGLEVDILNGGPGIFSARYAEGSDLARVKKLLNELKKVPLERRTAKFVAIIALYDPTTKDLQVFEGKSEGYITEKPIGNNGFGYDPVFFNTDLGKTNAQASLEEKNRASHRGRALAKLKEFLEKLN